MQNRDGSVNQLLDFYPCDSATTIQIRDYAPRDNEGTTLNQSSTPQG